MPLEAPIPFACEVIPERARVRVAVVGELDVATVPALERTFCELVESGFDQLVIDLAGVTFMDSSGLQAILSLRESATACGCDLTLEPGPPAVQRIFELTGTSFVFEAQPPARRAWARA
jgi:anti-sigma B factor antagonist